MIARRDGPGRPDARRLRRGAAAAVFGIAALLAGCAPLGPRDVEAGPADSIVKLARGETLVVRLDANPSTGFSWTALDTAPAILTVDGEPVYTPREGAANTAGAGGVTTYRLRATAAGRGTLAFAYRRAWDTGVPPARMVRYIVIVE
jgi:inhibitor of cysteine peptidase